MATYQQILGGENLTGLVQGIKTGLVAKVPEPFMVPTRNVEGDTATYRRVNGNRRLARLCHFGSPAKRRGLVGIDEVPVKLIHSFESQGLPESVMSNLVQAATNQADAMGRQEVARQTAEFKRYFTNLRLAAVNMALCSGELHFDADGNLLPDSSGAFYSIDFGVPAGNKGQLDVFGDGALISATWSNAATDIVSQLTALKDAAARKTGYELSIALYGANVPGYLAKNNSIKEWIASNAPLARRASEKLLDTGEIADGLLGFDWRRVSGSFYEDADGSIQPFIGDDTIVFLPAPSADWYELYQGSKLIPRNVGRVGGDATDSVNDLFRAYGQFSYAVINHNPVEIEQFAGDTFLPLIKVPGAMFIADVTP